MEHHNLPKSSATSEIKCAVCDKPVNETGTSWMGEPCHINCHYTLPVEREARAITEYALGKGRYPNVPFGSCNAYHSSHLDRHICEALVLLGLMMKVDLDFYKVTPKGKQLFGVVH